MMIGIGTPKSQSRIERPIAKSPLMFGARERSIRIKVPAKLPGAGCDTDPQTIGCSFARCAWPKLCRTE